MELIASRLRQHSQLPVAQHVRFMPMKLCQKAQSQWHAQGCTWQLTTRLHPPIPKPTELSRIKLKTWTQQAFSILSEHSVHSTPLPFGIRNRLWRYTCLLMSISMLWHRQAIFESKGDKLSSSAECRIRAQRVFGSESPADWMPADKPTELSRIKLKTLRFVGTHANRYILY